MKIIYTKRNLANFSIWDKNTMLPQASAMTEWNERRKRHKCCS